MKKNFALIFFSLLLSLSLVYLLVFLWVSVFKVYKERNFFKNLDHSNYHEKYSNKVHHLRGKLPESYKKNIIEKEDYFFTVFSKFEKKNKDNYLIQGDSWAELLIFRKNSNKTLNELVKKENIGLINSGISSFSPSAMKVQYEILEKDYNIKPDYLISIIDQTDIGDELCRYKHNIKSNDDGSVKYIKREENTGAFSDFSKFYSFSKIPSEKKGFINFHITNYYFYKTFKIFKIKLYYLINDGIKNRNNYKCKFGQIQKYLFKSKPSDLKYFKKRTQEYIDFLETKDYLKNVFIVTFPHKKHLEGIYNINVSDIINSLNYSKKIVHLDFSELIKNGKFIKDNIYQLNDPASHLNEEAHVLYIKKIFQIINEKKY